MKSRVEIFTAISLLFILISCSERETFFVEPEQKVAFTRLNGDISGTIKLINSPYHVDNDIHVADGDSLTIEAGVELYFTPNVKFTINGFLKAEGNSQNHIIFSSTNDSWKGIRIKNSAHSEFRFCIISNVADEDERAGGFGALLSKNSDLLITNCTFSNNKALYGAAFFADSSTVNFRNNIVRNNKAAYFGGAIMAENSSLSIINNTFFNNYCDNHAGAITFSTGVSADVQNNLFYKNYSRLGNHNLASTNNNVVNEAYNFSGFNNTDPAFISATDLHLRNNSPCINAGNPENEFKDFDGSRNDQGAYGGPLGDW